MPDPPQSLGVARYYGPTLPTASPGNPVVSPSDKRGRPIIAALVPPGIEGSQWDPSFTTALVRKFVIAIPAAGPFGPVPVTLRSVACRVDASAPTGDIFVLLWNLIDVPADGTAVTAANGSLMSPVKVQHVLGVDDNFTLDFDEGGVRANVGLTINLSTTEFVQTLGGTFLAASASIALPVP